MPIAEPNHITPSNRPKDKVLDEIKRWVSGASENSEFASTATGDELASGIGASREHIVKDLQSHLKQLTSQCGTGAYSMIQVGDSLAYKHNLRTDWENLGKNSKVYANRKTAIGYLEDAKEDVEELNMEIGRLEAEMKKKKEEQEAMEAEKKKDSEK